MLRILTVNLLLVLTSLTSCRTQKEGAGAVPPKSNSPVVVATIERTACFGKCPMFKATFFSDGTVHYEGKRFVANEGLFTIKISNDEVNSIFAEADKLGYWGLDDRYDSSVTDFPSCITSVTKNDKTKSVYNRVGGPKSLKAFERHLESLLEEKEYVPVPSQGK